MKRIICISILILISCCQFNNNQNQKKIDSDEDGIIDSNDECPEEYGLEEFNGCPDSDEDRIIDSDDECPDEYGLKEFDGCPDSDEDGIVDYKDNCPDEFGYEEYDGCADNKRTKMKADKCFKALSMTPAEIKEYCEEFNICPDNIITYGLCEITAEYIFKIRELKAEFAPLQREIENGYIQSINKVSKHDKLICQQLIVKKKDYFYWLEIAGINECEMGTMSFDENKKEWQQVLVKYSPDFKKMSVFNMRIIERSKNKKVLTKKANKACKII